MKEKNIYTNKWKKNESVWIKYKWPTPSPSDGTSNDESTILRFLIIRVQKKKVLLYK